MGAGIARAAGDAEQIDGWMSVRHPYKAMATGHAL